MNKADIYELLRENGLWHEITEHPAVFNMAEVAELQMPYPEADAKNLFVRDDKKRNYYLITVKDDKRVDLKQFSVQHGTRKLSFASADDLMTIMGLIPGAVTPLGLLNDEEHRVTFYLDRDFMEGDLIGIHPNDNTATVWMKASDLIDIIKFHGNEVILAQI